MNVDDILARQRIATRAAELVSERLNFSSDIDIKGKYSNRPMWERRLLCMALYFGFQWPDNTIAEAIDGSKAIVARDIAETLGNPSKAGIAKLIAMKLQAEFNEQRKAS